MKLLRSCAALGHMKITLPATVSHVAETSEFFRAILKIRGLHSLDVYDYLSRYSFREPGFLKYHKYNEQALKVLKRPHRPAPVEEREEKGISYVAEPRISFVPINELIASTRLTCKSRRLQRSFSKIVHRDAPNSST